MGQSEDNKPNHRTNAETWRTYLDYEGNFCDNSIQNISDLKTYFQGVAKSRATLKHLMRTKNFMCGVQLLSQNALLHNSKRLGRIYASKYSEIAGGWAWYKVANYIVVSGEMSIRFR